MPTHCSEGCAVVSGGVVRAVLGVSDQGLATVSLSDPTGRVVLYLEAPQDAEEPLDVLAELRALRAEVDSLKRERTLLTSEYGE